jgi:predicted phosphodiesterase
MTRIAVLADVHGNLPALEAVLADIQQIGPDYVVVAGDVVNRGPQSKACLDVIRAMGWPVLFGNHEDYVVKLAEGDMPERWDSDWWLPSRRVVEELNTEEIAYLKMLPWFEVITSPGLPPIRIVHGSVRQLNEGLGFWMTDDDLLEAVSGVPERIVIGAHTHRSFDRRVNGRHVMNCGAVGAPFNGNPAAQYLVLTGIDGDWIADFRAIPYDRTPVYDAWERSGILESTVAQIFKYEVETATFHLMAYMRFCEDNGLELSDQRSFERYRIESAHVTPGRSLKIQHE